MCRYDKQKKDPAKPGGNLTAARKFSVESVRSEPEKMAFCLKSPAEEKIGDAALSGKRKKAQNLLPDLLRASPVCHNQKIRRRPVMLLPAFHEASDLGKPGPSP